MQYPTCLKQESFFCFLNPGPHHGQGWSSAAAALSNDRYDRRYGCYHLRPLYAGKLFISRSLLKKKTIILALCMQVRL